MKKKKSLLGLLLVLALVMAWFPTDIAHAQGNGVKVTRQMIGDNNTITVVRITNKVVEIEDGAFSGLKALKEIRVDSDNQYYASCNGCLYNKDYTVLICIPQNTTSVQVLKSIKSYTPHALDGLAQSRKDALNKFLGTTNGAVSNTTTNTSANAQSQSSSTVTKPTSNRTDFSQYVYNENGYVCFKYTGSGDSRIIIPEGVQKIYGFSEKTYIPNTDITYIYIPSSVLTMAVMNVFNQEKYGWDNRGYDCLYQCPNLKTVESAARYYRVDSYGVWRPLADGSKLYTWSPFEKIVYDKSRYYTSGSIVNK